MPYFNNTPLATEKISSTQPKILANFSYLQNSLNLNHTFNSNAIGSEASGSHQRLDMPNQALDIVALPTGIAGVAYSKGSNLFWFNGIKQPMSGNIAPIPSIGISTTPTTVLVLPNNGSVPNDCIGYSFVKRQSGNINPCFFMVVGGVAYIDNQQTGSTAGFSINSNFNLQYRRGITETDYNAVVKSLIWPV